MKNGSCHRVNPLQASRLRRHVLTVSWACLSLLTTSVAFADVTLPNVFSDHMVMQRRQANKVWGRAAAGEKITVTFGSQSHEAVAGADGAWQSRCLRWKPRPSHCGWWPRARRIN